jgi:6-phosphogluconolactonase
MKNFSRRDVLRTVPAAALAAAAPGGFAVPPRQHVFIGSNTPDGILLFDWNPATAEMKKVEVAARLANVDWITFSHDRKSMFAASEVDSFNGKPTGEVASYRVEGGKLSQISGENSAAKGTCYVGLDHAGRVLLSADYGGGAAASFKVTDGKLNGPVWSEHYTGHGPVGDRQESAHAHFASFSPDNRFAYINDLGSDCIHIYKLNSETAELAAAGKWTAPPGTGPRTLHFHPNGLTAYCMDELVSAVDVLHWNKADGSFTRITRFELNPNRALDTSTGCDTVITRDGRFVYFANRGDNFIYACSADPKTGALTPIAKTPSGGKTPRNFVLDPTERWMVVANQGSSNIAVFARNPQSGELAKDSKSYDCPSPMCILFA